MNYLAHLFLAEDSDESLLGNLLGDFVKGTVLDQYSPEIVKGIKTHRKVDAYTDQHPKFLECKKLLREDRRRFAGVIIDLGFDHFLAKNWSQYSSIELNDFAQRFYGVLLKYEAILPPKLLQRMPYMIQDNWLVSYQNIDTIELALNAISRRLTIRFERASVIRGGIDDIKDNYDELEEKFTEFFAELIRFVDDYRKEM
ncbi:MAG: ACP phosphodiesterase [Thermodesulfobacteriota bacterium]